MKHRRSTWEVLIILTALMCATSVEVAADTYYDKFGIWEHDITAYKQTAVSACRTIQQENPDPLKPPGSVPTLKHFVRLYADCQRGLEKEHASIGILRVNSVWFGATCLALGALDVDDPVTPECNMKSYLPKPK